MIRKLCECGCGEESELRKGSTGTYKRFKEGHRGRAGDRYKAEKVIGRQIPKGVEVHHHGIPIKGGQGRFKDTPQLVLCENHKYHCYLHARQRDCFNIGVYRSNTTPIKNEEVVRASLTPRRLHDPQP